MRTASEDLTTRARIRDTAIGVFGSHGFTAGVRSIATAAGVSPGLLNHHFGSKDGLRTACDEHVLRVIRESKAASSAPAGMMEQLARIDEYAPLVAYIVRSFAAGGTLARELFEHMVDDAVRYIEDGVRDGRFTPSRDPAARARFLTRQNVGGLLLYVQMAGPDVDFRDALSALGDEITLPALELYTDGLFTDSQALHTYLEATS
ncbi:TetR family transcriptional regulator [Rhodococcus sp. 05-340-1]|uniref:TetR/AcrR family transcriptional regulator n=1 Tax=unclassified Rhodococcus (in: high G+C Gram-positive bacteria) TaxID=192944 RepID=UPI000B9BD2B9|nr:MULTISPECIES: TetR family transcriptional regulator [unclassified Rhodococcus (in: high G+C Gram-positive bacteria)]OZD62211.1 TetR family transcriptional regulator [Rhodococcus sp. 05-340-2]OZD72159.1 TetR family transcriptional regulator [Rhodococcus sp. 05-340-1]